MDILNIAKGGSNKTSILYGANLNSKLVNKYLDELVEKNFLDVNEAPSKRFTTTGKGVQFLKNYRKIKEVFDED